MSRWHLNHEYHRYYVNQLIDPDFDCLDDPLGGLTLAQIRDPIALEFGEYQDLHRQALDRKCYVLRMQRRALDWLVKRLRQGHQGYIQRRTSWLGNKTEWLHYGIKIRLWRDRQQLKEVSDRLRRLDPGRGNYRRISWW